jgi:hypothetical protein
LCPSERLSDKYRDKKLSGVFVRFFVRRFTGILKLTAASIALFSQMLSPVDSIEVRDTARKM